MTFRIVGLAGSFSKPSKTRSLVERAAEHAARQVNGVSRVIDLNDIGPTLGSAYRLEDLDETAAGIVSAILEADALVIGVPVFKGSYPGLFKHLIDLIDPAALKGKPILLTATGGGHRHALIIEHQLRPLFGFFEAATVATGVYGSSDEFTDGKPTGAVLLERLDSAVEQLSSALTAREHRLQQHRAA